MPRRRRASAGPRYPGAVAPRRCATPPRRRVGPRRRGAAALLPLALPQGLILILAQKVHLCLGARNIDAGGGARARNTEAPCRHGATASRQHRGGTARRRGGTAAPRHKATAPRGEGRAQHRGTRPTRRRGAAMPGGGGKRNTEAPCRHGATASRILGIKFRHWSISQFRKIKKLLI